MGTAQAIRRFRDLEMPIEEVRQLLQAPDEASRNRAILVHLERMHRQLDADPSDGGIACRRC